MPVGAISLAKELPVGYQPLLLCRWTFGNGTILRMSSHAILTPITYGGFTWIGRITNQDVAIQAAMSAGVDAAASVQIEIADPDKAIYLTYDQWAGRGFKGAKLEMLLVFWNVGTSEFSSDEWPIFVGYCDSPKATPTHLTVTAVSRLDLSKVMLPAVRIQKRCPWIFPATAAERAEAHSNADSDWYECGYCPEQGVGIAGFTECDYTKSACSARGMYELGRFGGVQWAPPATFRSRSFGDGGNGIVGHKNTNEAKYNDYVPMVWGKGWVEPPIMNMMGGGDVTGFEALISLGEIDNIEYVVVNDIQLQQARTMDGAPLRVDDPLLIWEVINRGDRDGSPNQAPPFDGKGDPYGSMAAIVCGVYKRIATTESTPRVRVLVSGPKLRVFTDQTTWSKLGAPYNQNPVWQYIDLLTWGPVRDSDINMAKAIATAAKCDEPISYTDSHGATVTHPRFSSSFVLRQRTSALEVLRGLRTANRLMVYQENGLIQIELEQTLADQQPAPVTGSNDTDAYASKTAAGAAATGYVAYHFDESSFLLKNGQSTLRMAQAAIAESPNVISCQFQDADNLYFPDSITVRDTKDVSRAKREVDTQLVIGGLQTYDQAKRIIATTFSKLHNGNTQGDTRGTIKFDFETTVKGSHLHPGHLVSLSHAQWALAKQLFRIESIQPTMNYETVKIRVAWHNDNWYLDTHGQVPDPEVSNPRRDRLARPPYGWMPNQAAAAVGDPIVAQNDLTFAIAQEYEDLADGTKMVRLVMTGKPPVNEFGDVEPPFVRQGAGSLSGGDLDAGIAYWACLAATDSAGKLSPPCAPIKVLLPDGATNGSFSLPNISWADGTAGYVLFAGTDPNAMAQQLEGSGTPSSLTVTTLKRRTWGPPDVEFDHLKWRVKRVRHSGIAYGVVASVSSGSITIAAGDYDSNEFANRDATVIGVDSSDPIPVANFRIQSNTADVLTLASGSPSPVALGINAGDLVIIRSTPTVGSNYLEDAGWQSSQYPDGMTVNDEAGALLRIISGPGEGFTYKIVSNTATRVTIDGEWVVTPTSASRYIIEEADWQLAVDSASIDNTDPAAETISRVDVSNLSGKVLLVMAVAVDGGGAEAWERLCPFREIYVFGEAGTAGLVEPQDVTITSAESAYTEPDANGKRLLEISVEWTAAPGDPVFAGGHIYYENPDRSSAPEFRLDGSTPLDATTQLAGEAWKATDAGKFQGLKGTFRIEPVADIRTLRIYVAAFSNAIDTPLVRATEPDPTPSVTLEVSPFVEGGGSGTEVAPLVLAPYTASIEYDWNEAGDQVYRMTGSWTNPVGDPRFSGVKVLYKTRNHEVGLALELDGATTFTTGWFAVPPSDETFLVAFLSYNAEQRRANSFIAGTTPAVELTVSRQNGSLGQEKAPVVTAFAAEVGYATTFAGNDGYYFFGSWTNPEDLRKYRGVKIVARFAGDSIDRVVAVETEGSTSFQTSAFEVGFNPVNVTIYAVSLDANNRANTIQDPGITPKAELQIDPQLGQSGEEHAPLVTDYHASVGYTVSEAGDELYYLQGDWNNPADGSKFRGVKVIARFPGDPVDRTLAIQTHGVEDFLTSPWAQPKAAQNVSIYFVSLDANNRANTITGNTPKVDLVINPQIGAAGVERAPLVSVFDAAVEYNTDEIGGQRFRFIASWTNPTNKDKYRGVKIIARKSGFDSTLAVETEGSTYMITDWWPVPETSETYTIYAVSIDANNRENTVTGSTPNDIVTVTKAVSGALKLNRVDLNTVSGEFRFNAITGRFEMHAVDFSKATAFDLQMFEVSSGTFKYKELLVEKLKGTVASFGGVGQAGLLAVFNSLGALIGWIGDDRFARTGYAGTGSGFEGAWFLRLLIGGTSPATAKIIADSSGNVAITNATISMTAVSGAVATINAASGLTITYTSGNKVVTDADKLQFQNAGATSYTYINANHVLSQIGSAFGYIQGGQFVLSGAVGSVQLDVMTGALTSTSAAAGAASALPATPVGYLRVQVNGVDRKVAYYA